MSHILPPPRVAAIHDLSCLGRCALTVILPTLSVMGYQVIPLPTALLSTHTGGFTDLHFRDLTDDMDAISRHFSNLGTDFRAIYSGFLGSDRQIKTVSDFIDTFGKSRPEADRPLVLVDPVMGDDGELYSTYTEELVAGVRLLSRKADLLTPNLTEACLLTHIPYRDVTQLSKEDVLCYAEELMSALERLGVPRIVITGIHTGDGLLINYGRNLDGSRFTVERPCQKRSYPGTGDIFASVLLGSLLENGDLHAACTRAADFIVTLIKGSTPISTPTREGVALEAYLHLLCKQ